MYFIFVVHLEMERMEDRLMLRQSTVHMIDYLILKYLCCQVTVWVEIVTDSKKAVKVWGL